MALDNYGQSTMNWHVRKTQINDSVWHFVYTDTNDVPLTFRQVIGLWVTNTLFLGFHSQVLSDVPFQAYRWETPFVDLDRYDRDFEFVALNSPSLDRSENPAAFQAQFDEARDELAVEFENLGRNATLVVPTPAGPNVNHCHLKSFLQTCSAADESALWKKTGEAMLNRISEKPVWLSTAGGGVAWLHIRLDNRPKYYGYAPYRVI